LLLDTRAPKPEFRNPDAPPGVLDALTEGDEAQEELAGSLLTSRVQRLIEFLGTTGERAAHPAARTVGGAGQYERPLMSVPALAPLEKLGERVLQQR